MTEICRCILQDQYSPFQSIIFLPKYNEKERELGTFEFAVIIKSNVKQMEKGAWCMVHVAGCEPGREFPDTLQPATCNLHHSKTTLNNYN